jgi:hypothetical protein
MTRHPIIRTTLAALVGAASIGLASAQDASYETGTRATLPGSNSGSVTPNSPMARTPEPSPAELLETGAPDATYSPPDAPASQGADPSATTSPTDPEAGAIQIEGQTAPANPVE